MNKLLLIISAILVLSLTNCGGSSGSKEQIKKEKIEIVAQNLAPGEYSNSVMVVIHNNHNKTATYVDLSSFFYDAQGNIIASGIGNATNIAPNTSKTIEILCADDVSRATQYKVELGNVMW